MRTECHFSKSYQIEKERETDGQNTIINEHHGSVQMSLSSSLGTERDTSACGQVTHSCPGPKTLFWIAGEMLSGFLLQLHVILPRGGFSPLWALRYCAQRILSCSFCCYGLFSADYHSHCSCPSKRVLVLLPALL